MIQKAIMIYNSKTIKNQVKKIIFIELIFLNKDRTAPMMVIFFFFNEFLAPWCESRCLIWQVTKMTGH